MRFSTHIGLPVLIASAASYLPRAAAVQHVADNVPGLTAVAALGDHGLAANSSLLGAAAAATSVPVALYGQCGGIGYTGNTVCTSGAKCTVANPYYSQCLPCPSPTCSSCPSGSTPTQTQPTGSSCLACACVPSGVTTTATTTTSSTSTIPASCPTSTCPSCPTGQVPGQILLPGASCATCICAPYYTVPQMPTTTSTTVTATVTPSTTTTTKTSAAPCPTYSCAMCPTGQYQTQTLAPGATCSACACATYATSTTTKNATSTRAATAVVPALTPPPM